MSLGLALSVALLLFPVVARAQVSSSRDTVSSGAWNLVRDPVMPAARPAPLVLTLNKAAGTRFVYGDLSSVLSKRGIASLRIDLRGYGERSNLGTFVPGDPSSRGGGVEDVIRAQEYVKTLAGVDTTRIAILTASYSEELAAQVGRTAGQVQAYGALSPSSFSDSTFRAMDGSGADWLLVRSPNERFVREWLDDALATHGRRGELWISDGNAAHASDILLADRAATPCIADWLTEKLRMSARRPPLRVTYLANEGVMLESPLGRVLIDALFGDGLQGYHRVEPPLRDSLERAAGAFGGRAVVLATHAHRDHFDAGAIVRYLGSNPHATAILPADALARTISAGGATPPQRLAEAGAPERSVRDHDLGWVHVRALGMPHGPTTNVVDHSSYLVTLDGWTALHIGDTQMPPSDWHVFGLPAGGVDVALVPYWYLINETYASQLVEAARPRRIVALHAPVPGADGTALRGRGGWASAMREVVARFPQLEVPSSSGEAIVVRGSERIEAARTIGCRLRILAVDSLGGTAWPGDELVPHAIEPSLGEGVAGHVMFFLALHEFDPAGGWLADARRGGDFLLASLPHSLAPAAGFWSVTGLYGGAAGVGVALRNLYRTTGDARYADGVRRVIALLDAAAQRTADTAAWGDGNDVLNGAAGTILFLLDADANMQARGARVLAAAAGRGLIARAERSSTGLRWKASTDAQYDLPNFSHGTAGVGFTLARLFRATGDSAFLRAALEGARHLQSVADTGGGGFLVFYGWPDPGWARPYDLGWAHGPAGTARLFDELHATTGDTAWLRLRGRALAAIRNSGVPGRLQPKFGVDILGVENRFGLAGMIPFLLDRPGDEDLARSIVDHIVSQGKVEDGTLWWERPRLPFMERPGEPARFTNYFYGSAGFGLALLRLEAARAGMPWPFRMPDEPTIE